MSERNGIDSPSKTNVVPSGAHRIFLDGEGEGVGANNNLL